MGTVQELSAHVDVEVRKSAVRVFYIGSAALDIDFSDVAAWSRALSVAKESAEYQAWLTRKGLA